jgi:hypothetical protein
MSREMSVESVFAFLQIEVGGLEKHGSILKTRVKKDGLDFRQSKGAEVIDPEE